MMLAKAIFMHHHDLVYDKLMHYVALKGLILSLHTRRKAGSEYCLKQLALSLKGRYIVYCRHFMGGRFSKTLGQRLCK